MKYIDTDKSVLLMYRALYDGVGRTRTHASAGGLKDFIENDMILEPVYWLGLGFRYSKWEGKGRSALASYFRGLTKPLKGHVLPLVAWNKDNGKVRHDIHAVILARRGIPLSEKIYLVDDIKGLYKLGNRPYVKLYNCNRGAVFYQTLKHKEIPFMTFCDNKKCRCRNKDGTNNCELRKKPKLLLR